MMTTVLELLVDPMGLFCVGCILLPLAIEPRLTAHDWVAHLGHPANIFCLGLLIATVAWTGAKKCVKLSLADRVRARWYLLNGIVIHILMDGMVGTFKINPYFARNYGKLDRRYASPLGEFNGSAVHIVSAVELFVKGPICLLLYAAYHRGHPARDALEFFTCVTQVYGTIVYLGQEALTGGTNMDVDWNLEFSFHYVVFFWFAVVFGCLLYFVVPGILGWQVYSRLVRTSKMAGAIANKPKRH